MKNTSLVIFLLVILILAVIGLNIRKYTEVFTEGSSTTSCYDWAKEKFPQFINDLDTNGTEENNQFLDFLKIMNASTRATDGSSSEIDVGSPCIFLKDVHAVNGVDSLQCFQMNFPNSNARGDCLYPIENTEHLTSLRTTAKLVNDKKVEHLSGPAAQGIQTLHTARADLSSEAAQNVTAMVQNSEANGRLNRANTTYISLAAQNASASNDLGVISRQVAQQEDLRSYYSTRTQIAESLNSSLQEGRSTFLQDALREGALIFRQFTLTGGVIGNATQMNLYFNNLIQARGTYFTQNFNIPNGDFIAMEFYGFIRFPRGGNYTFGLTSDDASDLAIYLDGRWDIVTSAYGYKPTEHIPPNPGTRQFTDLLRYYPIRIRFHENWGAQALNVLWKQPNNQNWSPISFSVFSCNANGAIRSNGYPEPRVSS